KRDKYDVYAFHLDVPAGVTSLDADFQYLSPRDGGYEMTDRMLMLEWDKLSLYPAGHYSRDIHVTPSVTLPSGWQFGSALETAAQSDSTTTFKPVSYNNLVDSPMYAGQYFKRVQLNDAGQAPVHLDIVADAPKYLEMTPEQLKQHRALVTQAVKLFGSHHYDHYDFLFSLSDELAGNGLEHHQSSEDGMGADYFTAWADNAPNRDLLAHEYVHSWNGKFRRPADLTTPNFNVPMGDSLLWVYEGQTQYWGFVLTARAGLWTPQQFRDALAMVAANYDRNRPGFQWRTLEDTTNDATAAHRSALPYRSWQMSEDYYSGGFLRARADALDPPLLDGLAASGWKLVYTDTPSAYEKQYNSRPESSRHMYNFAWSIGLTLTKGGEINDVRWNGPAFKAGVSTGATVVAVNGQAYSSDALKEAITAAKADKAPIQLLLKYLGNLQTVPVDYHGGLQYPHLERIAGTPDYLDQIIAARK